MKIFFKYIFIFTSFTLTSQQESYYTFYQYNMNVINPAFAGTEQGDVITILDRNQWVGLEGAPRTLALSYSRPMKDNVGLGISIVSDKVFIEKQTFAYIDFSYKLQVEEKTMLYLGLKAGGNFYNADPTGLITYSNNSDPSQVSLSSFNPNIGIGAYAKRDNHWFSFSIPRLFNTNRKDDLAVTPKDRVHTYLGGGSEFAIDEDFSVKPSLMLRKVKGLPLSADITSFVSYQNKYDLGLSFRTKAAFSVMIFLTEIYQGFDLGYAYESPTVDRFSEISKKTHEIILRVRLGGRAGSKSGPDDDNDGTVDTEDAFPLDPTEDTDTDSDGIGNNTDTDDDLDDAFPLDSTEDTDTDSDGIGNNTDTYDDGVLMPEGSYYYRLDLDGNGNIDFEGWVYLNK